MTPVKIAVIDDDSGFTSLMQDILDDEGYEPVSCDDPGDALQFLRDERPALLVLDLWMGSSTAGLAILSALRADPDPALATLPVIVCSADWHLLDQREVELMALGCTIVRKPFDLQAMLNVISELAA